MANTTSGTYIFDKNYAIDDVIMEAYERIGLVGTAGNQIRSAKRSLNVLFLGNSYTASNNLPNIIENIANSLM